MLLNSWQPHVYRAVKSVHEMFKGENSKYILTESDLKCWLFYYLQQEKPYTAFAVHTEVTHYHAREVSKGKSETKYRFRDMSLLCPWLIRDNEKIWEENIKEIRHNKGFKHNGPAIHFELKYVRQNSQSEVSDIDITNLNGYSPSNEAFQRRYIIIWGSRSKEANTEMLKKTLLESLNGFKNDNLSGLLEFYLFDRDELVHAVWHNSKTKLEFTPLK